ncbi:MAG: hypothetical protein LBK60_02415 [Verrucomicrobiales bacterium]|nr:hypothetical protein [Verrucomicrobiales bacterium]
MKDKLKKWFRDYPEARVFVVALALWGLGGLALEPFTATYGLAFLHKFTVFLARLAVSIGATMALVRWLFPSVREFRRQWFRTAFVDAPENMTAWDKQRALATLAVYLVVWLGCILALSL